MSAPARVAPALGGASGSSSGEVVAVVAVVAGMPAEQQPRSRQEQETFLCPITQEIMLDPVIAADGYTYERRAIESWLKGKMTSPMTNQQLSHKQLIPNNVLRSRILECHPHLAKR